MKTSHFPFLSGQAKRQYLEFIDMKAKAWPVPCQNKTVNTSYGSTFIRISGPPGAPPLVLLPGGGSHSLMWIPNIEALSVSFRTYALDSIIDAGCSANTRPIKEVDDLIGWLDELFELLGFRSELRLLGLSHGAWLAANYAQRYSTRIAKLVLLAPAGWILPLRPTMILSMLQLLLYPKRFFIRRAYRWSLPDLAASGPSGLKIIEDMTDDLSMAFRCFGAWRLFSGMLPPTVIDDTALAKFEIPTLFVIGENEKIYSPQMALDRLERVAPTIKRAVITGAGHDMTWLRPEVVNQEILNIPRQSRGD